MSLAAPTAAPRGTHPSWSPATAGGERQLQGRGLGAPCLRGGRSSLAAAPDPLRVPACRRLESARALLRAGADPNYTNGAGDLVLFWAIDGGALWLALWPHPAGCSRLPAVPLPLQPTSNRPPIEARLLLSTTNQAGVEMVKLLVQYGVDLDAATPKGWTPLSYCK